MSNGLPCPNPVCTYVFPHAAVKGATALTCPKCGTLFQFRPGTAAAAKASPAKPPGPKPPVPKAAPPARPMAAPPPAAVPQPPAPPLAKRAAPAAAPPPPRAMPVAPAEDPPGVGAGGIVSPGLLRRRRQPPPSRWPQILLVVVILLLVVGLPIAGYLMFREEISPQQQGEEPISGKVLNGIVFNQRNQTERAFRLVLSPDVWQANDALKKSLKAVVALERSAPDAWLAIAASDYGTQTPRDAELLKRGLERLEGHFGENLELSPKPDVRELAGVRALALQFRGSVNNVVWSGECYMLTNHGFGYWLYIGGAPTLEVAQQVLNELQGEAGKGFVLADERRGWSEQPPKLVTYAGEKEPFILKAPESVWERFKASDVDPNAELFLHGRDVQDQKDNLKSASVLVVALPKSAPDLKAALQAARAYIEESKQVESKEYKLVQAAEKPEPQGEDGKERKVGNKPGRVAELRLVRGDEPKKYVLLAVVQLADRILVIQCEAHWHNYQAWRGDFLDLLNTFHLAG